MSHDQTIIVEGNEHYDHVGVGSITQDAANTFENIELTSAIERDTSATTATAEVPMAPTLVPNAFGKSDHGALCWDVQEWILAINSQPDLESGQTNSIFMQIATGGTPTTSLRTPAEREYVVSRSLETKNLPSAAGESSLAIELTVRVPTPQQIIGGESFHKLLTKARYHMSVGSSGNATARTARIGMTARQVMVPLTEVFLDRDTVESLISFGVLAALF